jgi:hypothetical protein
VGPALIFDASLFGRFQGVFPFRFIAIAVSLKTLSAATLSVDIQFLLEGVSFIGCFCYTDHFSSLGWNSLAS